jgi:hypothetical protein
MCSIGVELEDISLRTINIINNVDLVMNLVLEEKDLLKFKIKNYINLNENIPNNIDYEEKKVQIIIFEINKFFKKYNSIALLVNMNPLCLQPEIFLVFKYFVDIVNVEVYPSISSIDCCLNEVITRLKDNIDNFIVLSNGKLIKDLMEESFKKNNLLIMEPFDIDEESMNKILKIYNYNNYFFLITCKSYIYKNFSFQKYSFRSFKKIIKNLNSFTTLFIPSNQTKTEL